MSCPEPQQEEFAHAHRIRWRDPGEEHFALSWEEVRQLDRRHVVGCHTLSHTRLSPGVERAAVLSEIVEGKRLLEERLGHEVEAFAWGREESSYSRAAAEVLRDAGVRFVFTKAAPGPQGAPGRGRVTAPPGAAPGPAAAPQLLRWRDDQLT